MRNILNVAEKPSIAKAISAILAQNSNKRTGYSKYIYIFPMFRYNPCYDFEYQMFQGHEIFNMVVTSVSGHLFSCEFEHPYNNKNWTAFNPVNLLTSAASVSFKVSENNNSGKAIQRTLEREAKKCFRLIIWTDCDREGEAIGNEIVYICRKSNPSLLVSRAKFSAVSKPEIEHAIKHLGSLDENAVQSVLARSEIDLRIGASFTRLQTTKLKLSTMSSKDILSFGPCQIPTLGLVVNRFDDRNKFETERFWTIELKIRNVSFKWERDRLFDFFVASAIFEEVNLSRSRKEIKVERVVKGVEKRKPKPIPLNTVALQIAASKYLNLSSMQTMNIAEKLYQKGFISYPRTETTQFPKDKSIDPIEHTKAIFQQFMNTGNSINHTWSWIPYIQTNLHNFVAPRDTGVTDNAHPPIYPLKIIEKSKLNDTEKKLYNFICTHHLATISLDAIFEESRVTVTTGQEWFHATSQIVKQKNFLEVYSDTFSKIGTNLNITSFTEGEFFQKLSELDLKISASMTKPPNLLTEADLIKKMEMNGIGTDATIQQHIHTVQQRGYVTKINKKFFVPTVLGCALIQGYKTVDTNAAITSVSEPDTIYGSKLRAAMESDLKLIACGNMTRVSYISKYCAKYEKLYQDTYHKIPLLFEIMRDMCTAGAPSSDQEQLSSNTSAMYVNPGESWQSPYSPSTGKSSLTGVNVSQLFMFCNCGEVLSLKKAKTEKNADRPFISCPKSCGLFIWADTNDLNLLKKQNRVKCNCSRWLTQQTNNTKSLKFYACKKCGLNKPVKNNTPGQMYKSQTCHCNKPVMKRQSKKANKNKGRYFYSCESQTCGYFQWDNSVNVQPQKINQKHNTKTYNRTRYQDTEDVPHEFWESKTQTSLSRFSAESYELNGFSHVPSNSLGQFKYNPN